MSVYEGMQTVCVGVEMILLAGYKWLLVCLSCQPSNKKNDTALVEKRSWHCRQTIHRHGYPLKQCTNYRIRQRLALERAPASYSGLTRKPQRYLHIRTGKQIFQEKLMSVLLLSDVSFVLLYKHQQRRSYFHIEHSFVYVISSVMSTLQAQILRF